MKRFLAILLSAVAMLSLAVACSSESTSGDGGDSSPETVKITSLNAEAEEFEQEVPYNPQRLAVMDLAALDMIDNFGFGDRVVGVSKGSSIDYLQEYVDNDDILNLGTIKEASLEAVMECEPDLIFIGGRLSSNYEDFAEIAPVVYLATDSEIGLIESVNQNAKTVASIFGVEDTVSDLLAGYDTRIEALQEVANGNTAFVGMLNSGAFNALGNDGRCSIIGVEIGFDNIGLETASSSSRGGGSGDGDGNSEGGSRSGSGDGDGSSEGGSGSSTSTHGNETSFEFIVEKNPDYIFVMNRDDAIGTEGAETAQEVIENELVQKTDAYKNGNIVYLEHSNVWYTAEGGITALDYMLQDLESALLS